MTGCAIQTDVLLEAELTDDSLFDKFAGMMG